MRADFTGLLEHVDVFRGERRRLLSRVVPFDEIRKMERAGQAAGPGANNQNVRVEAFAFEGHEPMFVDAGEEVKGACTGNKLKNRRWRQWNSSLNTAN